MPQTRKLDSLPTRVHAAAEKVDDKARNERHKSLMLKTLVQSHMQQSAKLITGSKELIGRGTRLATRTRAEGVDFLRTELDVGLTFARIALESQANSAKRRRNTANARKAYDSFVSWEKRVRLTAVEKQKFETKLKKVKSILVKLGETL